ncbi:hypothetical protein [Methylococcus capsulatus]|uniref:hypothetical protein n=1 Tax=Methylococcus capsulatus TaxID=414 RepID=UPI002FDB8B4C
MGPMVTADGLAGMARRLVAFSDGFDEAHRFQLAFLLRSLCQLDELDFITQVLLAVFQAALGLSAEISEVVERLVVELEPGVRAVRESRTLEGCGSA